MPPRGFVAEARFFGGRSFPKADDSNYDSQLERIEFRKKKQNRGPVQKSCAHAWLVFLKLLRLAALRWDFQLAHSPGIDALIIFANQSRPPIQPQLVRKGRKPRRQHRDLMTSRERSSLFVNEHAIHR